MSEHMIVRIDADANVTIEGKGTSGHVDDSGQGSVEQDRHVPQLAVVERSCGCGPRQDCTLCNPRWFGWQPVSMKCSECGEYTRVVPGRWETCGCWRTVHFIS